MTYDPLYQVAYANGLNLDAFARLRVSEPTLLLDSKQVGGTPDNIATTAVTGSGAVAYQINRASTYLTVGAAAGSAVRQTKARAVYQPGKSMLGFITYVMPAAQANLRCRLGYFDAKNGIFLQRDGSVVSIVRRTYVTGTAVDTVVPQASWNGDKLDGFGPSGYTLDVTKANIFAMDLEWLGAGRVRAYMIINGVPILFHEFDNANVLTAVYMSNPNLPMRWEIEATAGIVGTATMESICASMNSEGGYEINGITAATDLSNTARTLAGGAFNEILAIRIRSAYTEFSTAFVQQLSVLAATSSNFLWRLVLTPTETVAGAWSNVNTASIMERNSTRTVTENTGLLLASGYCAAQTNAVEVEARPVLTLGTTLAGVTDVISLQVRNLGLANEDYLGSLTWREVY